jgi:hypothetical protein
VGVTGGGEVCFGFIRRARLVPVIKTHERDFPRRKRIANARKAKLLVGIGIVMEIQSLGGNIASQFTQDGAAATSSLAYVIPFSKWEMVFIYSDIIRSSKPCNAMIKICRR